MQTSAHWKDFVILHGVSVDRDILTLGMFDHPSQHGGEAQGGGNGDILSADPHLLLPADGQGPGGDEQQGGGGEPGLDQSRPAGQPGQQAARPAEHHNHSAGGQTMSEIGRICLESLVAASHSH